MAGHANSWVFRAACTLGRSSGAYVVPDDRRALFRSMVVDGFPAILIAEAMGWSLAVSISCKQAVAREARRFCVSSPDRRVSTSRVQPSQKTLRYLAKLDPSEFVGGPLAPFIAIAHSSVSVAGTEE